MKKTLALLLSILVLLSLFVGCSKTETKPEEAPEPVTEEVAQPESVQNEADVQELEEEESSEAVKPEGYTLPLFEEEASVSFFYALKSGFPSREEGLTPFWARLEENLNIDISWQEPSSETATEKFNLMVASGDMTDLVHESSVKTDGPCAYTGGYDKAIAENIYVDLSELIEEKCPCYSYVLQDENIYRNTVTDEGNIGTFMAVYSEMEKVNLGLAVNTDYFEATGMDVPNTIDQWYELAIAMKNVGCEFPIYTSAEGSIFDGYISNAMGASIATGFLVDAASEELVFAPTTAQSREYIELFSKWYNEGLINPDFLSATMDSARTDFSSGKVGTNAVMGQEIEKYFERFGVNVTAMPLVIGEGCETGQTLIGDKYYTLVAGLGGVAVTTSCQDLDTALRFCDWFYSDEGLYICNYGWIEGETYEIVDGQYRVIDEFFNGRDAELNVSNKSLYTRGSGIGLAYPNFNFDIGSEYVQQASNGWTPSRDLDNCIYYSMPAAVSLTSDESERVSSKFNDLDTFVDSTILKWLVGEEQLNDDSWNSFVQQCEVMNLDEITQTYTDAYRRYLSR